MSGEMRRQQRAAGNEVTNTGITAAGFSYDAEGSPKMSHDEYVQSVSTWGSLLSHAATKCDASRPLVCAYDRSVIVGCSVAGRSCFDVGPFSCVLRKTRGIGERIKFSLSSTQYQLIARVLDRFKELRANGGRNGLTVQFNLNGV